MQDHLFDQMEAVQKEHFWFRARTEILLHLLDKRLKPNQTVLDVGCGTGLLLSQLPQNLHLQGLDINEHALSFARKRLEDSGHLSVDLRLGSLPNKLNFRSESADFILLTDVLEHIENDGTTLQALHGLLKPTGQLLLTVPAFDFLWSKHDEEHHHFRRYRREQLRQLLLSAGFTIEKLSYYNFRLFPIVLLVRFLKKMVRRDGDDMALPSKAVNKLLCTIFSAEKKHLEKANYPFGVSLLAIVRKT
jgi:SAM-dependent methyltransferase